MTTLQTIIHILPVDPREAVIASILGIALGRRLARTQTWATGWTLIVWASFISLLMHDGWHPIFAVLGGAMMLGFWSMRGGLAFSLPPRRRLGAPRRPAEPFLPAPEAPAHRAAQPGPPDLNALRQQMREDDRRALRERRQEMANLRRQGSAGGGGRGARR